MKQLLFLLLFPCLALAQYPANGNQKISLGEQTTADGLVFRGVASIDTVTATSKITRANKQDTSAFLLLDTVTNLLWHYKTASNGWIQAGGGVSVSSFSGGTTGLTPSTATTGAVTLGGTLAVANGGTNRTTMPAGYVLHGDGTSVDTSVNLFWDRTNSRLGIGTVSPASKIFIIDTKPLLSINDAQFITLQNNSNVDGNFTTFAFKDAQGNDAGIFGIQQISHANNSADFVIAPRISNGNITERMRIANNGNVGIGQTTPTAVIHLKAGTATASTAPLKFTSGVNLTTAEAGAMEFNGTNLFFSPSTTRHTVNHGLTGSATLNFPSTLTNLSADLTITVTGAADGDVVSLGVPNAAVNANTCYTAWVSAANTVTVRFNNYSSGTVDPASGSFKVFVTK